MKNFLLLLLFFFLFIPCKGQNISKLSASTTESHCNFNISQVKKCLDIKIQSACSMESPGEVLATFNQCGISKKCLDEYKENAVNYSQHQLQPKHPEPSEFIHISFLMFQNHKYACRLSAEERLKISKDPDCNRELKLEDVKNCLITKGSELSCEQMIKASPYKIAVMTRKLHRKCNIFEKCHFKYELDVLRSILESAFVLHHKKVKCSAL